MSEEEEASSEKTEQPTEQQRRRSREEGQVPRSRELMIVCQMLPFFFYLLLCESLLPFSLSTLFSRSFQFSPELIESNDDVILIIEDFLSFLLWFVFSGSVFMFFGLVLGSLLPGGLLFSPKLLLPKLSRISPVRGFKNIFSAKGFIELVKSLVKTSLVIAVMLAFFYWQLDDILLLSRLPFQRGVDELLLILVKFGSYLLIPLTLVALFDVIWQWQRGKKQLMQTKQQAKDTRKSEEGSAEAKERIRSFRAKILESNRQKMLDAIPDADVIIRNPTHYAVALKYDTERSNAPTVIAKGLDGFAEQIIELGQRLKKPLFIQPYLARVLYYHTTLGEEISPDLYRAVAQVIVYILQMDKYKSREIAQKPVRPTIRLPERYQYLDRRE